MFQIQIQATKQIKNKIDRNTRTPQTNENTEYLKHVSFDVTVDKSMNVCDIKRQNEKKKKNTSKTKQKEIRSKSQIAFLLLLSIGEEVPYNKNLVWFRCIRVQFIFVFMCCNGNNINKQ